MSDAATLSRTARESLARGLNALQGDPNVPRQLLDLAAPIAQAMGSLHQIERSGGSQAAPGVKTAVAQIQSALAQLQAHPPQHPAIAQALEAVAAALGTVHILARMEAHAPTVAVVPPPTQARSAETSAAAASAAAAPAAPLDRASAAAAQPKVQGDRNPAAAQPRAQPAVGVQAQPGPAAGQLKAAAESRPVPAQAQPGPAAGQPKAAAELPAQAQPGRAAQPQPERGSAAQPKAQPERGPAAARPGRGERQPAAASPATPDKAAITAELGAHSPSNFYKGLSGNDIIDHGGLFVSTYKLPKIGSSVRLRVALPGGYEFEASAVVRWCREPSDAGSDAPPGFGAQFTEITAEARQLVYRYVRNREPLFHDDL